MKHIAKYILGTIAAAAFVSCDLDIKPLSDLASGNWNTNETEIEMTINDWYRPDFFPIDEFYWDDDMLFRDKPDEVTQGTMTSESSYSKNRWSALYKGISRSLKLITDLENGSAPGISDAKKNQYLGEAYCFLGFCYGELVTYWGDVILAKEPMQLEDAYNLARSPKAEVMAFAYECFDKAASMLPAKYSGQSRLSKGAALGFKSRFAMQQSDWAVAADASQKCMELGVYKLHDNYLKLFQADYSDELIFWFRGDLSVPYGVGPFSNVRNFCLRTFGAHTNRGPSYQLYCSYLCTDGLPIDESPLYDYRDPFNNRDPRMKYTIQPFKTPYSADWEEYNASKLDGTFAEKYPDYLYLGVEFTCNPYVTQVYDSATKKMRTTNDTKGTQLHSVYTGLPMRKYVKDCWIDFNSNNLAADNVFPYLRYAEVLMNYVEAKNELGQLTQADVDKTLNLVRARAYNGTGIDYPKVTVAGKTQAQLRKIIRMERRMEFPFEGMRYRDLLRWKIAEKTHNTAMYYLPRTYSGAANWNGKRGSESNITLAADFEALLDNWDNGCYPLGGVPKIDEDGLPDLAYAVDKYITIFFKMSFDPQKNYLWPIPAADMLINDNIKQNPGY